MFSKQEKIISKLPDNELIELFRHSHDNKYVGHLYLKYSPLVLGLCIKYYHDVDKANDALMNIFELLIKELKKHKVDNFKSWLYSVSKNYCLQDLRKNKTKLKKSEAFEIFFKESMEIDDEKHQLIKDEKEILLIKMDNILPSLNYEQQKCLKMFYLEGNTYAEISVETGYTLNEVKSYIQNGKRNLKTKMLEK
jgi:RNA polymerase sigma-70 factor (ECF subfamily)